MKGWFDAFRTEGGPTLYSHSNRTPVTGDVETVTLAAVFCTIFIAFLVIFPGVRKERFSTFMSVTLSLFVGSVILVSQAGSGWHVACSNIVSSYRAFSREKISAQLGAYVGLGHVNVTLTAPQHHNATHLDAEDIDFNERFHWSGPGEMQERYRAALERGLPFPILTVAEVLNLDQEGFSWGRQYREAGYYTGITLWSAFSTWLLMNLLLAVVPRYGAYTMAITGLLLLASNLVYYWLLPEAPLVLRFENGLLHFRLGWCFWLVLAAGALCTSVGLTIAILDLVFPHHFSTILEVDYDTPYDRHVIIEDSRHRGRKKKSGSLRSETSKPPNSSLEDPPGAGSGLQWGSRILRRLSKRERPEEQRGLDNNAFEMDPPKSPWSYPHMMKHHMQQPQPPHRQQPSAQHRGLERALPARFTAADVARQRLEDRRIVNGGSHRRGVPVTRAGVVSMAAFRRSDSQESACSTSTTSSFGLGFLRSNSHREVPAMAHRELSAAPSRLSVQ